MKVLYLDGILVLDGKLSQGGIIVLRLNIFYLIECVIVHRNRFVQSSCVHFAIERFISLFLGLKYGRGWEVSIFVYWTGMNYIELVNINFMFQINIIIKENYKREVKNLVLEQILSEILNCVIIWKYCEKSWQATVQKNSNM